MDRSRFKQALNELDSNQRIALLYLEDLIKNTQLNYLKRDRAEKIFEEINKHQKEIIDHKEDIKIVYKKAKISDVLQMREDLVNAFELYVKKSNYTLETQMKKLETRYDMVIEYDNKIVNRLIKTIAAINNGLVDAGYLSDSQRMGVATLQEIKNGIIKLKEIKP